MKRYIDKDIIVAEINRRIEKCNIFYIVADNNNAKDAMEEIKREIQHYKSLLDFLDTLEVKEVDLEQEIQQHINDCLDIKFPTTDIKMIAKDVEYTARKFFELGLKAQKGKNKVMKTGIELIAEERQRQIEVEGWTKEHDIEHTNDSLALAAVCYTMPSELRHYSYCPLRKERVPDFWPWDKEWWKPCPEDRIRELIKAGALIAAEIDRLQVQKGEEV